MGGDDRATDEEEQRHQHPRITTADRKQGAGGAAAPQLHADAENKCTEHHRNTHWRDQPDHGLTEQRAGAQCREKQQYRHRQHDHLRAQAGTAPVIDKHPPG